MKTTLIAALRSVRSLALWIFAYAILHALFGSLTEDGGLVTPDGQVSFGIVLLGVCVLGLRLFVFFVVPVLALYRIAKLQLRGGGAP